VGGGSYLRMGKEELYDINISDTFRRNYLERQTTAEDHWFSERKPMYLLRIYLHPSSARPGALCLHCVCESCRESWSCLSRSVLPKPSSRAFGVHKICPSNSSLNSIGPIFILIGRWLRTVYFCSIAILLFEVCEVTSCQWEGQERLCCSHYRELSYILMHSFSNLWLQRLTNVVEVVSLTSCCA